VMVGSSGSGRGVGTRLGIWILTTGIFYAGISLLCALALALGDWSDVTQSVSPGASSSFTGVRIEVGLTQYRMLFAHQPESSQAAAVFPYHKVASIQGRIPGTEPHLKELMFVGQVVIFLLLFGIVCALFNTFLLLATFPFSYFPKGRSYHRLLCIFVVCLLTFAFGLWSGAGIAASSELASAHVGGGGGLSSLPVAGGGGWSMPPLLPHAELEHHWGVCYMLLFFAVVLSFVALTINFWCLPLPLDQFEREERSLLQRESAARHARSSIVSVVKYQSVENNPELEL